MNIFKIEQLEGTKDLTHVDISLEDLDMLETLEVDQVVLEDNGICVVGFFTEKYLSFIVDLFEKHEIKYKITDVTSEYTNTTPIFNQFVGKYKNQEDQIKSFMINNTSVDDILDKISKYGMESLNEVDYVILNK
jgi:hypothetical protein